MRTTFPSSENAETLKYLGDLHYSQNSWKSCINKVRQSLDLNLGTD